MRLIPRVAGKLGDTRDTAGLVCLTVDSPSTFITTRKFTGLVEEDSRFRALALPPNLMHRMIRYQAAHTLWFLRVRDRKNYELRRLPAALSLFRTNLAKNQVLRWCVIPAGLQVLSVETFGETRRNQL